MKAGLVTSLFDPKACGDRGVWTVTLSGRRRPGALSSVTVVAAGNTHSVDEMTGRRTSGRRAGFAGAALRYGARLWMAAGSPFLLALACGSSDSGNHGDGGPPNSATGGAVGASGAGATVGTGGATSGGAGGGSASGTGGSGGTSNGTGGVIGDTGGTAGDTGGRGTGSGGRVATGGVTGTGNTSGQGGSGGGTACPPECFVPNYCVAKCGDTPHSYGCCPCPTGMTNSRACASDGGRNP